MADLQAGEQIASYRVEALIGRGGMGVVYRAEDLRLDRKVALKVMASDLANAKGFRERFTRESRLAAAIDHPNIVPVYEAGEAGDMLFIAMRYVEGVDLRTMLDRDGPMSPEGTLQIVGQAARALDAAHRRGLVHRDVKPANIVIDDSGHAYLTDFGLTKREFAESGLTLTGQFVGTIDYIAPEQIQGKPVDARTDVYALGCVLYECLTGRKPFRKDNEIAVIYAHLSEDPPSVRADRSDVPAELDMVLQKAMAKDPTQRYQTCVDMVTDAENAIGVVRTQTGTVPSFTPSPPAYEPPPSAPAYAAPPPPPGSTPQYQPTVTSWAPSEPPPPSSHGRPGRPGWLIPAAIGGGVIAIALILLLVLSGGKKGVIVEPTDTFTNESPTPTDSVSESPTVPADYPNTVEKAMLAAVGSKHTGDCERRTDDPVSGEDGQIICHAMNGSVKVEILLQHFTGVTSLRSAYTEVINNSSYGTCANTKADDSWHFNSAPDTVLGRLGCKTVRSLAVVINTFEDRQMMASLVAANDDDKALFDYWAAGFWVP